jgi:hypothetical protein
MVAERKGLKARAINAYLARRDEVIVPRERLYEWQLNPPILEPAHNPSRLSEDARKYLAPDNPRLGDLKARYAKCDPDVITPLEWREGHVRTQDIAYFRGDNAYLWQVRGKNCNILSYALATYYVKSIDKHSLLETLVEDNVFGNFTFEIAGHVISRDLLDSIIEINFLDRHLGFMSRQDVTLLDIGAGYGRLAYRASAAVPGLRKYLCADAVPYSTFISEFYLRYRNALEKTQVIALDEFEQVLADTKIDIAVNIHSFSECRLEAIEWWISRLARAETKYLMIAPNAVQAGGMILLTNDGNEFLPIINKYGYQLLISEPKYLDPIIQEYAVESTFYYLFELR